MFPKAASCSSWTLPTPHPQGHWHLMGRCISPPLSADMSKVEVQRLAQVLGDVGRSAPRGPSEGLGSSSPMKGPSPHFLTKVAADRPSLTPRICLLASVL